MPDPAPPKHRQQAGHALSRFVQASHSEGPPYAELHCKTNYSFLRAASHPDELAQMAAELGYRGLAITDRNSLAGVVRAHGAAKQLGLKLLIGAEVTPADAPTVVLLATDRAAYGRLASLLTIGKRRATKGECHLTFDDIAAYAEGLLACVPLQDVLQTGAGDDALYDYRDAFPHRCYALAELHLGPDDARTLQRMQSTAKRIGLPLAAANDVHYHVPQRQFLQDVVTAIREGCSVAELGALRYPNAERYLKSSVQLTELFADCPEVIGRSVEVADRCSFSLDELKYEYPRELAPVGVTSLQYLRQLTWEGAQKRYPRGLPERVQRLIEHEFALIEELHYEAYFLTVWDLVRFARSQKILCQGRGSAANSAVCYCLGVTSVNPDQIDVLFERFVSKERNEAPDIDVDFEHERREEVIQYIYAKYGRERAGMTAEFITYRLRSAIRDVGKALGLSLDRVDVIAKAVDGRSGDEHDRLASRLREAGMNPLSRIGRQFRVLVQDLLGFPRHLSQHVGGMVLTDGRLCEFVPIENAAMPDRTVIEWDKDDLDELGLLKVDCLALGMLTAIRKCFSLLEQHYGRELTLAEVPAEDPAVYDMVCEADTMGVFQIESRAQMSMLPRLRPRKFYDLVIEVAIVRPGPIQGDMVHPYLRRRNGEEQVEYPNERIKAVLHKTLGVPIFQEQAMRLAIEAAGFTPGEADQLRRAMGAWRRRGSVEVFRQKLIDGMQANGYDEEFAERVFKQISGFGEYGFPESHSASFALLVYVSCWLKKYYPAAFTASLLNSQPMGFYAPAQLIRDVRDHGVEVRPIDVNHSTWDCTLEPAAHSTGDHALRLGLRMVRGFSQSFADIIVDSRLPGAFVSFADFARRTGLSNAVLTRLSKADAFGSLDLDRRAALWNSLPVQKTLPLFNNVEEKEPPVALPAMTDREQVAHDYTHTGLSLRQHPVSFVRPTLEKFRVLPASQLKSLPHDRRVKVAGLVLLRQRPSSAKGVTFVTLEDETGHANLIVRQEVWDRHHRVARRASAMVAHGRLQRQGEIIHVLVSRMQDLSELLSDVETRSRDFR